MTAQAADTAAGRLQLPIVLPGLAPETQAKLVVSLVAILVLIGARRALLSVVDRKVEDSSVRYRWAKTSSYVTFLVGLLVVGQVWFTALRSIGTFLGLLSAGVAIALKDVIADLAGWVFILWRRPFEVGDRVQVGEHAGDVVDIRIFAFTLMEIGNWVDADQSTGRMIHVPNATVFTRPQANYTAGFPFIWNELRVPLTFDSDWRRAKEILGRIAEEAGIDVGPDAARSLKEATRGFLIHYTRLSPTVYTSVDASGPVLTLRYLTRPRERRGTAQLLWERILTELGDEPGITFAHPTQRVVLAPPPQGGGQGGAR